MTTKQAFAGSPALATGQGIPSPALTARNNGSWPPMRRPTWKANPYFGGSEDMLWPFHVPQFASPMMTSCSRVGPYDAHQPQ